MTADRPVSAVASGRLPSLAWVLLTVVSGVYGIGFWLGHDPGPPPEAFVPAAAALRRLYRPGDLLILAPFYATRARELLGDLDPVAPKDPMREDLRAHPGVLVFGLFGEGEALQAELVASGLIVEKQEEPAPGITVARLRNPAAWAVSQAALPSLRQARVYWEQPDGQREACSTWNEQNGQGGRLGRWACPRDQDWFYVAPEWHFMGDVQRLCLWAHPPTAGRLVVALPNVAMTGHLFGRAGHTLNSSVFARERVDLDVRVGDGPEQRIEFGLEEHWRPFALSTPSSGTATVTFAVSSPDAGANHFCFVADTRSPPQPTRTSTEARAP